MKKFIALLLTLAVILSLCACGKSKKAFDVSKEAYDKINSAYSIVEEYGEDVYGAWRLGIYEEDEILDKGCKFLATELHLTEDELKEGVAYTVASIYYDKDWDELTEEEKNLVRIDSAAFNIYKDDLFSFCVSVASNAYIANGKVDEVQESLSQAKILMKELSDKYSDYEHYPALKGYYTTTSSYFDFCQNPTGSFEQIKTTEEDYKTTARDYKADLSYIFED